MQKPNKTYKVEFRATAQDDLYAIYMYIAEHAGIKRAGEYVQRVKKACMSLDTFPMRGTQRDNVGKGFRTIGFEKRATILFIVQKDTVEIINVAYGGKDYQALFTEEE